MCLVFVYVIVCVCMCGQATNHDFIRYHPGVYGEVHIYNTEGNFLRVGFETEQVSYVLFIQLESFGSITGGGFPVGKPKGMLMIKTGLAHMFQLTELVLFFIIAGCFVCVKHYSSKFYSFRITLYQVFNNIFIFQN